MPNYTTSNLINEEKDEDVFISNAPDNIPLELSQIGLWVDCSNSSFVQRDGLGNVTRVYNKTPNVNSDLVPDGLTVGVTYDTDKRMLKFEGGSTRSLLFATLPSYFSTFENDMTYFIVFEEDAVWSTTTSNNRFVATFFDTSNFLTIEKPSIYSNNGQYYQTQINSFTTQPCHIINSSYTKGKKHIIAIRYFEETKRELFYNGLYCGVDTCPIDRTNNMIIGGLPDGDTSSLQSYFEGYIGEIVATQTALDRQDMLKMFNYLNNKWDVYENRVCDIFVVVGGVNARGNGGAITPGSIQQTGTSGGYYIDPEYWYITSETPISQIRDPCGRITFWQNTANVNANATLGGVVSTGGSAWSSFCDTYYKETGRYAIISSVWADNSSVIVESQFDPDYYTTNYLNDVIQILPRIQQKLAKYGFIVHKSNVVWHQGEGDQATPVDKYYENFIRIANLFYENNYDNIFYYIVDSGNARTAQLSQVIGNTKNTRLNLLFDCQLFTATRMNLISTPTPPYNIYSNTGYILMGQEGAKEASNVIDEGIQYKFKNVFSAGYVGQQLFDDGSLSNPSISFKNDIDLGMYRPSANHLRVVANNDILADFTTTHFRSRKPLHSENGSASAPTYSFESDNDTGIYRVGADELGISTNGSQKVAINDTSTFYNTNSSVFSNAELNTILTPTGRLTWATTGLTNNMRDIIWADEPINLYIAINVNTTGAQSTTRIHTSPDGIAWTARTGTQTNLTQSLISLAYGNGTVVIVSSSTSNANTTWYSTNGLTYNLSPETPEDHFNNQVDFLNGYFITSCAATRYAYSTDGITWTQKRITISGTPENINIRKILFGNGTWIALGGSGNATYYTTNITNENSWTRVNIGGLVSAQGGAYSPTLNRFVITSDSTANDTAYYSNNNGVSWSSTTLGDGNGNYAFMQWISDYGGFFVTANSNPPGSGALVYSKDGITWSKTTTNLVMRPFELAFNPKTKAMTIAGVYGVAYTWAIASANLPNYIKTRNYIELNNDTKFNNAIEYKSNVKTAGYIDVSEINNAVLDCNTTSGDVDIVLRGSAFNGRQGFSVKVRKTISSANAVRLIGGENDTRVLTPLGVVASFNSTSSAINLIPATYFGGFDLVRVDDNGTGGTWYVNHMIYDANGVEMKLGNLQVNGSVDIGSSGVGNVNIIGTIRNSLGSATDPSYTFTGDTNTGIYSSAANTIDFTANGIRQASIDITGFSILDATLKPTKKIQYTPSNLQTVNFNISTMTNHIIRLDPTGSTLNITLDNAGVGSHFMIVKETTNHAFMVTPDTGFTYNNSSAFQQIFASGTRGILLLWQITSTAFVGMISAGF